MMHDVIISGAGPSGSQCAEVLTKADITPSKDFFTRIKEI